MILSTLIGLLSTTWYFTNPPEPIAEKRVIPIAEAWDIPHEQEWTPENVELLIRDKAEQYGVDAEELLGTAKCENPELDPLLQSYVENPLGPHGREDSWGVCQFHLPSGNKTKDGVTITKDMAQDPRICVDTMAWYFSLGEKYKRKWTCWRIYYGK